MNWQKLLSDLSITTEKSIDPMLIYLAIITDIYKETKNPDLKKTIETLLITTLAPK